MVSGKYALLLRRSTLPAGWIVMEGDGMIFFEDLTVGDSWTSSEVAVDENEMLAYGRANDPCRSTLMPRQPPSRRLGD